MSDPEGPEDPEDTAPFTHQPYGKEPQDNPFVSPSGPAAQPSGPDYVSPSAAPPPPLGQPPYGPPHGTPYGQPTYPQQQPYGYQPGWAPAYGAPYPGSLDHKGATTSLVLGIVSIVCLLLTPFCCITIPGIICAPFAWGIGAKAKREIQQQPGVYGNLGTAQTGMWMGIVTTILGALAIIGTVALFVWIGYSDPTLV